jgi:glutamine synthetase adenylyltransferase
MSTDNKYFNRSLDDQEIIEFSPFLKGIVGPGHWAGESDPERVKDVETYALSIKEFKKRIRATSSDPEEALPLLRSLRIRTLLDIIRADLNDRISPAQIQSRLKQLSEALLHGAWIVAETGLRERIVHPLILERRNIKSPVAILSYSRLGAGDPMYTTSFSPLFIHARIARFAPALKEIDFDRARRSGKEMLPARTFFRKLASRINFFLWVPVQGGKQPLGLTDAPEIPESELLPGHLVLLFSAFEEYFSVDEPVQYLLALLRLRFIVGSEDLGAAVEVEARTALANAVEKKGYRKMVKELDRWYHERAVKEGGDLLKGGLLDIERNIRKLQLKFCLEEQSLLLPSPLKTLEKAVSLDLVTREEFTVISRSYTWQWRLMNKLMLLDKGYLMMQGAKEMLVLDNLFGQDNISSKTSGLMSSAASVAKEFSRRLGLA